MPAAEDELAVSQSWASASGPAAFCSSVIDDNFNHGSPLLGVTGPKRLCSRNNPADGQWAGEEFIRGAWEEPAVFWEEPKNGKLAGKQSLKLF